MSVFFPPVGYGWAALFVFVCMHGSQDDELQILIPHMLYSIPLSEKHKQNHPEDLDDHAANIKAWRLLKWADLLNYYNVGVFFVFF